MLSSSHDPIILAVFSFCSRSALPGLAKEKYQHAGPIHLDRDGEKWAEKTLRKLSLEEKVGQLFMVWVRAEFLNVNSPEYLQLRDSMSKYHVGSFAMTVRWEPPFLYRSEPYEAAELLNRLQQDSKLPLLFAADFERGVTMRLQGATPFPHAMAFGAAGKADYAEAFGRITAQESRAVGVHWNFFPDADVNSNPANPIINTRSFGEDPQQVGDLVAAYIRGARANGMMTTAKHFPGHGDTATDSHLSVAQVTGDRARLDSVELAPFRKAIAAGVDSVMVAHVTVPALEPDPNRVATTSPAIVTDLLKQRARLSGNRGDRRSRHGRPDPSLRRQYRARRRGRLQGGQRPAADSGRPGRFLQRCSRGRSQRRNSLRPARRVSPQAVEGKGFAGFATRPAWWM